MKRMQRRIHFSEIATYERFHTAWTQSGHSRGSPPRPLGGPKNVISAKLQQPRDHLGPRQRFAIGFLMHIGGQHFFRRFRDLALGADGKFQHSR